MLLFFFFFFQAEDGIRDSSVTGVQTCALPIWVGEVGASVARCPRTPPDAAKTPGLQIGISNRLRGLSNRSIVVVCNYCSGPISAEPYRAKARPLHPRRSCFAPVSGISGQQSVIRWRWLGHAISPLI